MKLQLKQWTISEPNDGLNIDTQVPGDITESLHRAGIIPDPFFGLNHLELKKWLDKDYVYSTKFRFDGVLNSDEDLFIEFNGVDLFSDIYLNGTLLGKTDNMFKRYVYNVNDLVSVGENELKVVFHSTTRYMEIVDTKDYFAVFNIPRILLRKEQCCFGWDWSPNIPGYGLWQSVNVFTENKSKITDVHYVADMHGESVFFVELNYSVRPYYDNDGNFVEVKKEHDDIIRLSLSKEPVDDFAGATVKEIPVYGSKSFIGVKRENIKLWWPVGYGDQPLYYYKVELIRDGKVLSERKGRFAYRDVSLEQHVLDTQLLGYQLKVNGRNVYMKGSNWVPVDCFTGCVKREKYEKLIDQAVQANVNVLRVWGGGIYEKDEFYDLCDEKGVMVWQDLMFACADIPEDDEQFVKNASEEIEYQVKRLRNHPSLVYWCGGNEKTGASGAKIVRGDWFVNVIIRGIVGEFDRSRPFAKQSPCSLTDVANDPNSGETHKNSFEVSINDGLFKYRENVAKNEVPFISESAIMGPHSRQTFEKIFPKDKLWPINEYWEDRLMENPYAAIRLPFANLEYKFAKELYGEPYNLDDFIAKGMLVHAEALKCECEYQRAGKGVTSGFLNWMYSEIWPSGTWAVVDYYTEPKAVYYQMKKSYEPVLMSYFYRNDGKTVLFGVNDTLKDEEVFFEYGQKTTSGKVIWTKNGRTILSTESAFKLALDEDVQQPDTYLYVEYTINGKKHKTLYSWDFWSSAKLESNYTTEITQINDNYASITFKAEKFAKSVFINMPENYKYTYSDNYFDLEAGEEKTVYIYCRNGVCPSEISITDFASKK